MSLLDMSKEPNPIIKALIDTMIDKSQFCPICGHCKAELFPADVVESLQQQEFPQRFCSGNCQSALVEEV